MQVLGLFLVIHYLLLPQLVGARKSWSVISHLNPFLIVAGVLVEGLSLVAYAQMTCSLLPGAGRPRLLTVLRVQLATHAATHVVPGGTAAGTPLGYRLLRRAGVEASDASFVLSTQAIGSAVVLNVLWWIALLVSIPTRGTNLAYLSVVIAGVVVIGGFALLVFGMSRGSRAADWFVRSVAGRIPLVDAERVSSFLHSLVERFRQFASDRRVLVQATGWAALQWLADAASLWIFLAALGITMSPEALFVAFGLANVSTAIPLTPGGVGVYEAVLTSSLVGFGAARAPVVIGVLAYRLFEFWLPIPLGAVSYLAVEASDPTAPRKRAEALHEAYATSKAAAPRPVRWPRCRR